jgi:hypothetical protein
MKKIKFDPGLLYMSRGVGDKIGGDREFGKFCAQCYVRHITGDWGELDDEDKAANELALAEGYRLLSHYSFQGDKTRIWVITEADRSATTILFPDEY